MTDEHSNRVTPSSKEVIARDYLPWLAACSTDPVRVVREIERLL